jgi:signal transduction histidine kinase
MTRTAVSQLENPEQRQMEEALSSLLELSRVLATTRDIESALSYAASTAVQIVPTANKCTLQWLDGDSNNLHTVAFSDPEDVRQGIAPFPPGVGVAGHALEGRDLINVPDVLKDERFVQGEGSLRFRSLLVAPLVVKDRALGTLSLSSEQPHAFSSTDETLAGLMADQVAAALDNAHEFKARLEAEEALQESTERLQILHEIDQAILAAHLPETIAVAVIRRIRRLMPCQRAMITALDESGKIHLLAAEAGEELQLVADLDIYQEMYNEQALAKGQVQGVADLASLPHPSRFQRSLAGEGIRSYAIVPVFILDELVGALNLESVEPKAFTTDHVGIATQVAASLAVAIRQARLYEQAQQEIAERLRAEKRLRHYASDLEARNAELDAFAHTVAHDLKNPVTSVIAYAQVLESERNRLQPEVADKCVQVIAQNGRKMSHIIDDLLLLSHVREQHEIQIQPLDMGNIVAEACRRLRYMIEDLEGELLYPETWPVAVGYAPWIEAVWTNYISNALKYGGKPPRVELGYSVAGNDWLRFWARDNGPGLSAQEQAELFTPFERLSQMRVQGHGLGLSIVQRILNRLGGKVGVESENQPGKGCIFYFTLPALTRDAT